MTDLAAAAASAPSAPTSQPARAHHFEYARSVVSWALFGIALALFISFRPVGLGGQTTYAFVTGVSMLPNLHTGDLAVIVPRTTYEVGEIIAFRPGVNAQGAIIHRIVGGDAASGYVVQGDNKPAPDAIRPTAATILGRAIVVLPGLGWVLETVRNPAVLGILASLVAASSYWDWHDARRHRAEAAATAARRREGEDEAADATDGAPDPTAHTAARAAQDAPA